MTTTQLAHFAALALIAVSASALADPGLPRKTAVAPKNPNEIETVYASSSTIMTFHTLDSPNKEASENAHYVKLHKAVLEILRDEDDEIIYRLDLYAADGTTLVPVMYWGTAEQSRPFITKALESIKKGTVIDLDDCIKADRVHSVLVPGRTESVTKADKSRSKTCTYPVRRALPSCDNWDYLLEFDPDESATYQANPLPSAPGEILIDRKPLLPGDLKALYFADDEGTCQETYVDKR